jgi:hypothetical protein
MSNLIEMFNIISDPVKVAWAIWIGWGVAQIGWYRRTRLGFTPARFVQPAAAVPPVRLSSSGVRRGPLRPPLPVSTGEKQPWEQDPS